MALPSGYRQLEYIESTGTQWIDTGVIPNQDTRIILDTVFSEDAGSTSRYLYGCRESGSSKNFAFYTYNSSMLFRYNDGETDIGSIITGRYTIRQDKNELYINDELKSQRPYSSFTCPGNMYIFALNNNGNVYNRVQARVYDCTIYNNSNILRHFIPCSNGSGEVGLWDDVNSVFYGNAGSGVFTAGQEIVESVVSKVQLKDGTVLVDLTKDTVIANKLLQGCTAHDASGKKVTGGIETYSGEVAVTPGTVAHTLETAGKYLASNIEIAAAAGGMQAASGQVMPSNNQIVVSGLGFTPQYVIIVCTYGSSNMNSVSGLVQLAVKVPGYTNMRGYTYSYYPWNYETAFNELSAINISLSDGSFTITGNSSYGTHLNYYYNWYAIG